MPNAGGGQNGPLMSWAAAMDGQRLRGGPQAHDRAYRQGGGDGVGTSAAVVVDMMAVGIRQDLGGGTAQAEPAGANAIE
jgi:hypothetical protein